MTEEMEKQLWAIVREHTSHLRNLDERLQGVEGVEQPLVSQAAQRSERQGDAEQRSVESREHP